MYRINDTPTGRVPGKQKKNIMENSVIGKTFSYRGIGNVIYVMTVTGWEKEGLHYSSDSYIGKQNIILPNGNAMTREWSCCKRIFDINLKSGKYKRLR